MEKCCMCRNALITYDAFDDPYVIMIGETGDRKEVCLECEKQLDILIKSNTPDDIKSAIDYLYICLSSVIDDEVAEFLNKTIEEKCESHTE